MYYLNKIYEKVFWCKLQSKKERTRSRDQAQSPKDDIERDRRFAGIAVRCATFVGQAQRARSLLVGHPNVTAHPIGSKAGADIPEFLALDLVSASVLGERKRFYKSKKTYY